MGSRDVYIHDIFPKTSMVEFGLGVKGHHNGFVQRYIATSKLEAILIVQRFRGV